MCGPLRLEGQAQASKKKMGVRQTECSPPVDQEEITGLAGLSTQGWG